ncbi:MAG: ABC transporter substrate-binding protein [Acidobacteriota bacterium]|nr:MAG: ABC transporter substrate-binding protein [Acidobacteriota bacterium]
MNSSSPAVLTLLGLLLTAGAQAPQGQQPDAPYFEAREQLSEYHGPGRDDPIPGDLTEIRIGYFGPSDPADPVAGDLWLAAQTAIEEINAAGGYEGLPFRLLPAWSADPWGSGIRQVTQLVYHDQVWALIGSIDGPSTHLAEQVVAKARLTLINPGSTDKTVNLANVPWMFSCLPGEHLIVPALVDELLQGSLHRSYVLISGIDHDSRVFTEALLQELGRRGSSPRLHLQFSARAPGSFDTLSAIQDETVSAVIVAADPFESAQIVRYLSSLFQGQLFGGPSFGRGPFLQRAGTAAEGAIFPLPASIRQPSRFSEEFQRLHGRLPDFATLQTYDAVHLLAQAIRAAGLNRARIRDAVREGIPWYGVNGEINWDPTGQNRRPPILHRIRDGQIEALALQTGTTE